ncbi:MAG TPA: hypothetical protein IAC25_04455 [Candidatus Enterenecus stercoripullorum]|nr:hypothetical protein [Candidatus Enterenecus stercoripullorum]
MKESTLATKIMIGLLCAGVLVYLALYLLLGFQEELATTTAYTYSVNQGAEATGILVREERVLSGAGGYVELVPSEGEKTAAGDAVALVYSDASALSAQQAIQTLRAEIEQLQYALSTGTQSVDVSRLDGQVVSSIVSLRALAASGDLSDLEDSALNLRTMVFQRDYAYGDTGAAQDISQLIADKQSQLDTLNTSLSQVSQTIYAPVSGVFSGQVDGCESLTPDLLDSLTVQQLSAWMDASAAPAPNAIGKLVTDSTWYFAALLPGGDQLQLTQGNTYTISFSSDFYGNVDMALERIVPGEEQTLAIFSARSHLSDTTLLRVQTVDVVTDTIEGIRVPRRALRVETEDVEQEDGSVRQQNTYVVYTVVGRQAERKEVEVVYTGDTFYLLRPVDNSSSRLRAGDEVILNTSDIYEGKVVR